MGRHRRFFQDLSLEMPDFSELPAVQKLGSPCPAREKMERIWGYAVSGFPMKPGCPIAVAKKIALPVFRAEQGFPGQHRVFRGGGAGHNQTEVSKHVRKGVIGIRPVFGTSRFEPPLALVGGCCRRFGK